MAQPTTGRRAPAKKRPAKKKDAQESPSPKAAFPEPDAEDLAASEDRVLALIRRVLEREIESIERSPSEEMSVANRRARDARTLSELVRTLDKLDAVAKRREGKSGRAKGKNDDAIKAELIRRLDQLLAARDPGGAAQELKRG